MISIYSTAYNICKFTFNYQKNIKNWCDFVGRDGEVIVACNTSEDDSYERLSDLAKKLNNLHIIKTEIPYNNRFDGAIKTKALQKCREPIRILMDMDEFIPKLNRDLWWEAVDFLIKTNYDGLLIPTLDLYGSTKHIRKNNNIGQKFRIHNDKIKSRGVIKSAELPGGFFDTSKSDNTEPLLENGELGRFPSIINPALLNPENSKYLSGYPFTVHEGYLDLKRKADHGKNFWKRLWEEYSNHEENVATDVKELEGVEVIEHGLDISVD